ncbi:MAG: hypothetical protein HQL94_02695 [Magnetococcales bacterium]|nr:hypothetical protein [Magnetococcales bacterium]MBF0439440.1 hypothetical protein [Magnetococcales bacterium]
MNSSTSPHPPNWIDRLPWKILLPLALWLAVAPIAPEPHLVEKIRMLFAGTLARPIDIFDLVLHSTPLILVAIKAARTFKNQSHS